MGARKGGYAEFGTAAFNRLLKVIVSCQLELLQQTSRHLIITDVDLVWLRDPIPWLLAHDNHDFKIGGELRPRKHLKKARPEWRRQELNTGFMSLKPTKPVIAFWERQVEQCAGWAEADDQVCLNSLLLGPAETSTTPLPRSISQHSTRMKAFGFSHRKRLVGTESCDVPARVCAANPSLPFDFLPVELFPVTHILWKKRNISQPERRKNAHIFHAPGEQGLEKKLKAMRSKSALFLRALVDFREGESLLNVSHALEHHAVRVGRVWDLSTAQTLRKLANLDCSLGRPQY